MTEATSRTGSNGAGRRCPPKSRATAEKLRVIVHAPEAAQQAEPPGYSGHNGGSFAEAGYTTGRGQFGFQHHTIQ